jgi:hypothetical protein
MRPRLFADSLSRSRKSGSSGQAIRYGRGTSPRRWESTRARLLPSSPRPTPQSAPTSRRRPSNGRTEASSDRGQETPREFWKAKAQRRRAKLATEIRAAPANTKSGLADVLDKSRWRTVLDSKELLAESMLHNTAFISLKQAKALYNPKCIGISRHIEMHFEKMQPRPSQRDFFRASQQEPACRRKPPNFQLDRHSLERHNPAHFASHRNHLKRFLSPSV